MTNPPNMDVNLDVLYGLAIFIVGLLAGFAWGNNSSSHYEAKERLRQRIRELEEREIKREREDEKADEVDGAIEQITEAEQVQFLESLIKQKP